MNKAIDIPTQEEASTIARIIFDKGRNVHQRIDRLVGEIMIDRNVSVKNLTIAQMEVIMIIHQAGKITVTELANILRVSAPSASTMVDRLADKKILIRTRSKKDRRKVSISVSADTQLQIYQVEQAVLQMFTDLIARVGTEIGGLWCKVLNAVEAVLDDQQDKTKSLTP